MKLSIEEQVKDCSKLFHENLDLKSKEGPRVRVGKLNIPLHLRAMADDRWRKKLPNDDKYYWPKLWFKSIK